MVQSLCRIQGFSLGKASFGEMKEMKDGREREGEKGLYRGRAVAASGPRITGMVAMATLAKGPLAWE